MSEDDKETITVSISKALLTKIDKARETKHGKVSRSSIVEVALAEHLRNAKEK